MLFPITALYAALLMVIMAFLGFKIGSLRGSTGISILHGDNMGVAVAMRRHGNFSCMSSASYWYSAVSRIPSAYNTTALPIHYGR